MKRSWGLELVLEALGSMNGADAALRAAATNGSEFHLRHLVSDSRQVQAGDLFFALDGERARGADFIPEAFRRGAALAFRARTDTGDSDPRVILVDDPLDALTCLATTFRSQVDVPVVGITGSVGKTTVKEFLGAFLREERDCVVPAASFNNRLGVSLTLGRIEPQTEAVVVEMGTNAPGEIAELCALARPNIGVLTAIEAAHLSGLGDLEGVRREKLALARSLPDGAPLFLNAESEAVRAYRDERLDLRPLALEDGLGAETPLEEGEFLGFRDGHARIRHPFSFRAQRLNLWIAMNVARAMGISPAAMERAAERLCAPPLRGELRRFGDCLLVLDCYNANPSSTAAALRELSALPCPRRAVLGEMLELGESREEQHRRLGNQAARLKLEQLVFVGPSAEAFREGVLEAGGEGMDLRLFADTEAARDWVQAMLRHPGTLLFKGSRGIALETLLETRS